MNYGWVSIHRQLQSHWLWEDKPFSYGQAWIDLILMANHSVNRFPLGNEIVTVEPGSFITSELKLAEQWGWSKTKVRRFLMLLENDSMIVKKTDRKKTTITLVKYDVFQISETEKKPIKNRKKTDKKPIKNTNNNDNNDNNENNDNKYATDPLLNDAIIAFVDFRNKIKKPMTDKAIELMLKKLNRLSSNVSVQIEILNQSIVNGWSGIYELKETSAKKEPVPAWLNKGSKFNNFEQHNYDFEQLEDEISNVGWKEEAEALKKELQEKY